MIKWFSKLNDEKKDIFILVSLGLIVFVCLCPLFLIDKGAWPLGWLLGSVIEVICYITILQLSAALTSSEVKTSNTVKSFVGSIGRFFLYAVGLVISAICTFKSEWFGGFAGFNFFAVALSYLPLPIVVMVNHLISNKRLAQENEKKTDAVKSEDSSTKDVKK